MLSFEQFKKYLERYNLYADYEGKLANLGVNIWERDEMGYFASGYLELISIGLGFEPNEFPEIGGNDFLYWMYELQQGELVSKYFPETEPEFEGLGTDLKKVYDFLVKRD